MRTVSTDNLRLVRADLVARLEAVKKLTETISRDIEAVDRMVERYGQQTSLEINDPTEPASGGEFSSSNLREAVMTVLERHAPEPVKVTVIRDEVLDGGYQTKSVNISPAIYIMLGKLVEGNEAKKIDKGLFRLFG